MMDILRISALPAALVATLALTSCGASPSPSATPTASSTPTAVGPPATGTSIEADVMFATMMIPQHAQAVELADLALKQASDAKVRALAPKIKAVQVPEIALMTGWLTAAGRPVPGTTGGPDTSDMAGHTAGLLSAQQMADLGKATGSGFDRMWLQLLVKHHQGAVLIAKDELAQGVISEAKKLAQSIIDRYSAKIAEMTSILTEIPQP